MPVISPEKLIGLQRNPAEIRNVRFSTRTWQGQRTVLTGNIDLHSRSRCKLGVAT